jgi:hypothetical protein
VKLTAPLEARFNPMRRVLDEEVPEVLVAQDWGGAGKKFFRRQFGE